MEYYPAIERDEILMHATINSENILLSEISQTQKELSLVLGVIAF